MSDSDSDSDFDDDAMTLIAFSFCEILNPIPVVQVHYIQISITVPISQRTKLL